MNQILKVIAITSAIMTFIFVGAIMGYQYHSAMPTNVKVEKHTEEQELYLYMRDLGLERWTVACSVAVGKEGGDWKKAMKQCTIVLPK